MISPCLLFLAMICLCVPVVPGEELEVLEICNDNTFDQVVNYWCANVGMMKQHPGGFISRDKAGRSGACMKITNTAESVTALYSQSLIPVERTDDSFKLSFHVKGKGKYQVGFYTYSAEKKFINTFFEPATLLDTEVWVRKDYRIPAARFKGEVSFVRIAIEVRSIPAQLYFDDFSGSKESLLKP